MLLMVDDAGTRNVVRKPIITGPKSKAAARSLVMPMNVTSILPPLNASIMSAGLWIGTSSCGTPRRRASSMPISGLQPLSCPSCSSAKYDSINTPTRSLPPGASCLAVSAALCALAPAARPKTAEAAMNTAAADDRALMSDLSIFAVLERAHLSAELPGGTSRGQARPNVHLRARTPWPVVPAPPEPYAVYHGFCTHEPPVPGVAVIMHCSRELKMQV